MNACDDCELRGYSRELCILHIRHCRNHPEAGVGSPSARVSARMAGGVALGVCAALVLATAASPALADAKACSESFEKAQYLKKDGKLTSAREQALVCAREGCPGFMRDECTKMVGEIDAAQPSVIFAVRDAKGADLADVRVEVDGAAFAERLNGSAMPLDPGEHTLRFQHAGDAPLEQHVIIRITEKNRVISAQFPATAQTSSTTTTEQSSSARSTRGPLWPGFVVAGVGLALGGVSIALGLDAQSTVNRMRTTCAPACAHSDVSAVDTQLIVSDVLLVAGIAAVGVATVLFILRPGGHEERATVGIAPTTGGFAGALRVSF